MCLCCPDWCVLCLICFVCCDCICVVVVVFLCLPCLCQFSCSHHVLSVVMLFDDFSLFDMIILIYVSPWLLIDLYCCVVFACLCLDVFNVVVFTWMCWCLVYLNIETCLCLSSSILHVCVFWPWLLRFFVCLNLLYYDGFSSDVFGICYVL